MLENNRSVLSGLKTCEPAGFNSEEVIAYLFSWYIT